MPSDTIGCVQTSAKARATQPGSCPTARLSPDLALFLKPEYGGKMKLAPGELASGIPELIAEVCRSSRSYDLGPKLALYERAGVPEYLAILIEEKRFERRT